MAIKRFRLFAGPNGSGKTTFIKQISLQFNIGYLINADMIEAELVGKGYLDCSVNSPIELTQSDWSEYLKVHAADERIQRHSFKDISINEGFFISKRKINSYHSSVIADFFKEKLMSNDHTFSYETVMSHPSKVGYLKEAGTKGFKTYLYFIGTRDPDINKQRIKNRVAEGGHDVGVQKIEQRYYKSMELLYDSFTSSDRAFILQIVPL